LAELWRGERPLPGKLLQTNPAPLVTMLVHGPTGGPVKKNQVTIDLAVTDQGGGIKGPWLRHNGAAVRTGSTPHKDGKVVRQRFTVALVPGENRFEARATTADGSLEGEPALHTLTYEGSLPDPDLYVIAVGINRYAEPAPGFQLDCCVPDAQALADVFRTRAGKLYGHVHVTALLNEEATRERMLQAVAEVAHKARAQDTLVLYAAGHGRSVGQRFYLIPHEFRLQTGSDVDEDVRRQGLAIDDLCDALAGVPALKRVLVFDTCHSGAVVRLAGKRSTRWPSAGRSSASAATRESTA
jgi:hypothetical protein